MKQRNEIRKALQAPPRTLIQLMFQKKSIHQKLCNSKLKTLHLQFVNQKSQIKKWLFMFRTLKVFFVTNETMIFLFTSLSCHRTPIKQEVEKEKRGNK